MDVRCERCKTEYEFDDARITEAGVTVKCTTCGYVFKVKKKALFVTVPLKSDDASGASASPLTQPSSDGKEKSKDWKVRQRSGNVFNFKELTTLQKWIVERKVSRDDEISLTGETWKRLGDIAELATFFQVVDAAQKASQLPVAPAAALVPPPPAGPGPDAQSPSPYSQSPHPPTPEAAAPQPIQLTQPISAPAVGAARPPQTAPSFPAVSVPSSGPAQVTRFPVGEAPSFPETEEHSTPKLPTPVQPAPLPAVHTPSVYATKSAERRGSKPERKGGLGWLVALGVLLALGGGGYWAYSQGMLPMVDELLARARGTDTAVEPEPSSPMALADAGESQIAAPQAPADAGELAEGTVDAGSPLAGTVPDAGSAVAVAAAPDAGTIPAGTGAITPKRPEPVRDFDWYMNQGDRLRDRERAEAALEAYAQASELEPQRAEPVAGRGLCLLDMSNYAQAATAFLQALKLNPRYGVAAMGLAEAYRLQGKNEEAVRYYRRYLEISPSGVEAGVARSQIERLGN